MKKGSLLLRFLALAEIVCLVDGFASQILSLKGHSYFTRPPSRLEAWGKKDSSSNITQALDNCPLTIEPEILQESLQLLNNAVRSFNSTEAEAIVENVAQMRRNETCQTRIDHYLDALLEKGPDRKLPFWARFRFLTKFSGRARLFSLRKTLDLTTPPPGIEDEDQDDSIEDRMIRRRRALVAVLRQLAKSEEDDEEVKGAAIRHLERKAVQERDALNQEDMISRRPADLETPAYNVIVKKPAFEIRRYEPYAICSVLMNQQRPVDAYITDATVSDPSKKGARAFGALAGYLFGKNQQQQAMAMTTPVLSRTTKGGEKFMSFVLPSDYWKEEKLSLAPQPLQGSGVTLERDEGGDRAVIMFGGYASRKETESNREFLLDALASDPDWQAVEGEPAVVSQYNDPFTPPWKRLNEVSVSVQQRQS
jgi:hypothetical protein